MGNRCFYEKKVKCDEEENGSIAYSVYLRERGPIVYEPRGLATDLNSPVLVSTKSN